MSSKPGDQACANCYGHGRRIVAIHGDGVKVRKCKDPRSEYDNSRDDDHCRLWLPRVNDG